MHSNMAKLSTIRIEPRTPLRCLLFSATMLAIADGNAASQIYRCTGSDGLTFTQTPGPNCVLDDVKTYTPPPQEVARQKEVLKQWRSDRTEASKNVGQKPAQGRSVNRPGSESDGIITETTPAFIAPPIQYMTPVEPKE